MPELSASAVPANPPAGPMDDVQPGADEPDLRPGPVASLWRVREFVRPYRHLLFLAIVLALIGVGAGIMVPLVIRRVVDGPLHSGDRTALVWLSLLALALGMIDAGLAFLRRWTQASAIFGMERDLRDALYAHLQSLPPSFHDGWMTGQLLSRAIADLSTIRRFFGFGFVFLIVNLATFTAICSLLMNLNLLLGLVVTASMLPLTAVCLAFERRYSKVSRLVQDQQGDLATTIEEAATGIRVIKAFGRRRLIASGHRADSELVYRTQLAKVRLVSIFVVALEVIPQVTLALVLLLGALAVGQGSLTIGTLVAFITLSLQLVWPVESLGFILASAQEAGTAAQRVYEVFDTRPDITDPVPSEAAGPPRQRRHGGVRFEAVSFGYPGARRPVLEGVSLDVEPGETLALVGASGSGKTSLAMLVPRLADVTTGRVTVDGHDVRDLPLRELRTRVATAFEEPILFSASVVENVTLGRPEATEDDVRQALELAQAQFAYQLPWGLQTRVGEQGMSLSGGQRQRLALARAVLGRPSVLVLDDPLSALDVETEALVERALRQVLATTTAILVVHRPSTVALADRVALLQQGRITAVGTHDDLMRTQPGYADLMGELPAVVQPSGSRVDSRVDSRVEVRE